MALTHTPSNSLGTECPHFSLRSVDEKIFSRENFGHSKPLLVMFICNHCPYVKAIEDRLIQLGHDLKRIDVDVIAICSNDPTRYAEDSFENLKRRWIEKAYSFPYLHDPDQTAARSFEAVCTPDFFLYDKNLRLAYRGRLDDSWKDPSLVTKRELYEAAKLLAQGNVVKEKQTPSMGCSIKWLGA